jgi:hypothetical protein
MLTASAFVAFGALEGYAFFKSGMVAPSAIIDQMAFRSMIVMKLFVSAVGTSMVAQSAMEALAPAKFAASRQMSKTAVGFPRAIGGCLLLGVGMGLSGSGPTIVPAQLFAGAENGLLVTAGCLAGGIAFSLIEPTLFSGCTTAAAGQITTLDAYMRTSYRKIAGPLGLAMVLATLALESVWSNAADQQRLGNEPSRMWNPILAGIVIGLNQLPLRFLASKGQGGSTSIMNIIATATGGTIAGKYALGSIVAAAQLLYVWGGTSLGAYAGKAEYEMSYGAFDSPSSPSAARAFLGGMCMITGARIAMGCTCGHGISGFSELSFQSMAAAASIFAGGIGTCAVINATQ